MTSLLCLLLSATAAPPNIVFLTVDTLRADRLGIYGANPSPTPHLDRLAAQSMVFLDAVCEEPQTGPSFCSMFTGRIPRTTGVIRNSVPLPAEVPVLTEPLRDAGYATAAIVGNWNLKRKLSGLDRGFEHYDDDFGRGFLGRPRTERFADDTTDRALAWLAARDTSRPFFFWIHYMDPHSPYRYHGEFLPSGTQLRTLRLREQMRLRYDSEVAYMDHHVGRLLEALPQENTFIVFVADHGESLLEHDYQGHTRKLYHNIVQVPLFIHGPDVPPGVSSHPARGIDLSPTLLGLAGIAPLPGAGGQNLLSPDLSPGPVRVIETYGGKIPADPSGFAALADRPPILQSAIDQGWKLIVGVDGTQLYRLDADPEELRNLAPTTGDMVRRMEAHVEDWNTATPRGAALPAQLSEEDRRALEAAGYL